MTIIWSGLTDGALYALVAMGFNLVLTSSAVLNFAQGALVMLGTFIAYWALVTLKVPIVLAVILGISAGFLMGCVTELVAIRPLSRGRRWIGTSTELITTVAVATALSGMAAVIWGTQPLAVPFPGENSISFLGGEVAPVSLALIGLAIAFGVAIHLWYRHTLTGLACLASAEDRVAAALRGIRVRRLSLGSFGAAGALAGIVGLLAAPVTYSFYSLGDTLALSGFVALALGGLGSQLGCLIGGFLTGVVGALSARYIGGNYQDIATFVLLLLALGIRPGGLIKTQLSTRNV
ncbi:MAG TPA: branched-chain amino acid ABC transporter permease [Streptosporangiaceae bacterium]|nr:branched-chain amino acid ABC transporter permease [Streptosporangiaceae bacterium]